MTTVTIRGADSQKAMDEVLRILGPDALILSTRHVAGMVEVQATTDDTLASGTAKSGTAKATSGPGPDVTPISVSRFDDVFRAELRKAQPDPSKFWGSW